MSRPLRIEFEDALYHVTSRGNRQEPIFADDLDRQNFLEVVGQGVARFEAVVYAYCLMDNHYHFVLQTHRPNLSRLMRHINGVYAQAYNRRHRKVGHLFQGRFKAVVVDRDSYFLEVCRYVDLNPVRASMVIRPQDWNWSSYCAHVGVIESPVWLDSASLHRQLAPPASCTEGPARYAEFVMQGCGVRLWEEALKGQIYLGCEHFVTRMQTYVTSSDDKEIPQTQRRPAAQSLQFYFNRHPKNMAIVQAFLEGGHTQSAIAEIADLSVSRISRLIKAAQGKGKT